MNKNILLDQLLNHIRNLDGSFLSILEDENLSVDDKIDVICESIIDDMNSYMYTLESIK